MVADAAMPVRAADAKRAEAFEKSAWGEPGASFYLGRRIWQAANRSKRAGEKSKKVLASPKTRCQSQTSSP
jgi:hypothetical protein